MATGTADVAIMISQELAELESRSEDLTPGADTPAVVGIDPSANMLDVRNRLFSCTFVANTMGASR